MVYEIQTPNFTHTHAHTNTCVHTHNSFNKNNFIME